MSEDTHMNNDEYRDTYTVDEEDFNEDGGSKGVLMIIISLIVGFAIGWFSAVVATPEEAMDDMNDEGAVETLEEDVVIDDTTEGGEPVVDDERAVDPANIAIVVSEQASGDQVLVSKVNTPSPSWVVVYEDNAGAPGSILGARLVASGETIDVRVELQRGTTPASLYYVMIHPDNGDGSFDFKAERAYTDDSGARIFKSFMTSETTTQ